MREITLKIPDKKLDFVMELIRELRLEVTEEEFEIPEEHKKIVLERIRKSEKNPERLLDWEQVKNNFRLD
jgi:predicted Zn-dependent peptidase